MVLTEKTTRILAVGTPKKVARTPTVAQTMAPVLVADVETTNNSGSLGLGCSGLYGLALLLHILPTTIGPNPLSVLDHHSLVFLDRSLSRQLTMQMHPAQLILKQLFILSALLNLIRHGTWTPGRHLT